MKYELIEGEKHGEGSRTIQKIVRADDFDYITLIYDEKSDKCVKLNILEADKEC